MGVAPIGGGGRAGERLAEEDDTREKSDSMCVNGSRFVLLSTSLRLRPAEDEDMSQLSSTTVRLDLTAPGSQSLLAFAINRLVPAFAILDLAQLRIGVPRLELACRPRKIHRVRVFTLELFRCLLDLLVRCVLGLRIHEPEERASAVSTSRREAQSADVPGASLLTPKS